MAFLPDFLKKVKAFFAAFAGFFKELAGKLNLLELLKKLGGFLYDLIQKLLSDKKRRIIFFGGAGGLVLLIVIISLLGRKPAKEIPAANVRPIAAIPPEELFLTEEPDFVPSVLLERERRSTWTAEDAAPFWYDPLKNGEEEWREKIETTIDEYLERVP
jgi:hypothetical protein